MKLPADAPLEYLLQVALNRLDVREFLSDTSSAEQAEFFPAFRRALFFIFNRPDPRTVGVQAVDKGCKFHLDIGQFVLQSFKAASQLLLFFILELFAADNFALCSFLPCRDLS